MAGGGAMGSMPTGTAQQNGMGAGSPAPGLGLASGAGMAGMGFGGGQAPQLPQGDTFQPQGNMPTANMQQMSQLMRNLQNGQTLQQQPTQQPVQQQMVQQPTYQPIMQRPTYQPTFQQPMPQGGMPTANLQQMNQMLRGLPVGGQPVQPNQQGIAGLQQNFAQPRSRAVDRYINPRGPRR